MTFEEVNLSERPEALEELRSITNRLVVPVIQIENEVVIGFDPKLLEEKLSS